MAYTGKFKVFEDIIQEMSIVYQHDKRPWMIGYSGGKDSTLLCCLVMEMLQRLPKEKVNKTVYIVSSDTMVENPIVGNYMHKMSKMIGETGSALKIKADIIYPKTEDTFWCKVIGLGYPTPEAPGFRWCTERLKIHPMNKYTLDTIKNNGEVVLLLGVRKAESVYRANNIRSREIEGKILVPHNDIENAYVYNPLTKVKNENALLKTGRFLLFIKIITYKIEIYLPRPAAPIIPASFPSFAIVILVLCSLCLVYCSRSIISSRGTRRASPSLQTPPPIERTSGWKILIILVIPSAR